MKPSRTSGFSIIQISAVLSGDTGSIRWDIVQPDTRSPINTNGKDFIV
jgi:hypothetical protein